MTNEENLETHINNLLLHVQMAEESKENLCRMVVGIHAKMIKHYFDCIDNQITAKE
jgi:hypothetical protein